jgi:hypothetical protein
VGRKKQEALGKVCGRAKTLAHRISEAEADKFLLTLQQTLSEVAQRLCVFPSDKSHFVTLGLGKM